MKIGQLYLPSTTTISRTESGAYSVEVAVTVRHTVVVDPRVTPWFPLTNDLGKFLEETAVACARKALREAIL